MKQSMKIALKIKDEHLLLKVKFVNFTIAHRRRYDEYWSQIVQMYEELVEQCERLKMYNMLASIHNMMVIDPAFYRSVDEDMACCDKSIRICKKYGNIYKLSAIYHVKGMVLSFVGKNRTAFMYYKKSEELKKQLNNKIELVRIYNGMGYGLFLIEDFTNALNYYNKALSMLKGVKSYDEIGITIYNIGILYFYAKNYKTALLCFEKVISIINILKIKEIPFHSIFGLYCVVAICALKVDNYVKTLEYLNRIKTINHTNNYEEIFYYRLFEALINKREHNYIEAENNFKEAYKLLEHPSLKILFSLLQLEFGLMYKEIGQIEKAKSLFEDGLYCSRETKQSFHEKLFLKELSPNKRRNVELNLKEISFELDSIVEYAKQEVIFNKLHKKIDEINFLNYLQQILLEKINSKEELLRKTMELFNNYFVADEIYLISKENELKMMYKAGSINMEDSIIFKIVEAFPEQHDELLILKAKQDERIVKVTDSINSLVIVPFVENGQVNGYVVFIIQKESFFFNEEDLRIISLAIKQLYVALRNKSLEESIENRNVEIENKNKELESIIEKLKIAQEQLIINEKLASVGKLAGGIAHEINNPLGVILSNVELIKQDIDEKKEIDRGSLFESIDMIEEGVKRVRDIIFNLKKYTVSTKGILSIFDVKDIINSSVSIFGKEMQNYNIKLYSEMNENYKIEGNYVDIVQVLTSIISNSIDALRIVDREIKYIKLSVYAFDNIIHIVIEDNGIGMTEEIKKKIFDPFFTTKDVGKGIGLGLSISYDILKKHNVAIFVESEKDKGTKVMLKFPEISTGLNDNVRTDVFS